MIEKIGEILGLTNYYDAYNCIYIVVLAFIFIITFLLRKRLPWYIKGSVTAVVMVLILRVILLGNLYIWNFYGQTLKAPDHIGWRQNDDLWAQVGHFWKPVKRQEPLDFLAVGSSQVQVLMSRKAFSQYKLRFTDLTLAAMDILDLLLYRDYIMERKPNTIILYISQFDLGTIRWRSHQMAPAQGLRLLKLPGSLRVFNSPRQSRELMKNLVIGEFLPEYKYAFLFHGLKRKYFGGKAAGIGIDESMLREGMIGPFKKEVIEANLALLEEFIKYSEERGVNIIILEGEYNPEYRAKNYDELKVFVEIELKELVKRYDNSWFIPTRALEPIVFRDRVHANRESADKFRRKLYMDYLVPYLNSYEKKRSDK